MVYDTDGVSFLYSFFYTFNTFKKNIAFDILDTIEFDDDN